jgi:hypothetical protein
MDRFRARYEELAKQLLRRWKRGCRALGIAVAFVALSWTQGAYADAPKSLSADEFRADVVRLQSVVAECAASAAACSADGVGDDVKVGDEARGGFVQHWQWLRSTLDQAKTAKADERAKLLHGANEQLAELGVESAVSGAVQEQEHAQEFGSARTEANAVLSRGEFQVGGGLTWWDRLKAWALGWLLRFFGGVAQVGVAAPWLGTLLEWVFFVGAAVGLLFFLLRNVARQRLRVSLGATGLQGAAWDREAEDWATWAEQHAAAGEWREAVHCLYWAAIVSLEARRAWRHNPTRTPREYVRLLKAGSAQQKGLRRLTQIFEQVWYGLREASSEEYAEARSVYEQLSAGAAASERSTDGRLAAGGAA